MAAGAHGGPFLVDDDVDVDDDDDLGPVGTGISFPDELTKGKSDLIGCKSCRTRSCLTASSLSLSFL